MPCLSLTVPAMVSEHTKLTSALHLELKLEAIVLWEEPTMVCSRNRVSVV